MGNNMKNILSPAYSLKLKNIIFLLIGTLAFIYLFIYLFIHFFKWSYSQRYFEVV